MGEGLLPSCWGPALWHSLHSIALAYVPSQENKVNFYNFFASLGYILPCEECKRHYLQNFKNNEESLRKSLDVHSLDPSGLFRWVYDLHNLVNKQTGVPEKEWPKYEDIVKKYEGFKADCGSTPGVCGVVSGTKPSKRIVIIENPDDINPEGIGLIILGIMLFLGLIYYLFSKQRKKKSSLVILNGW